MFIPSGLHSIPIPRHVSSVSEGTNTVGVSCVVLSALNCSRRSIAAQGPPDEKEAAKPQM